ncbi:Rieske (2Fe-2S) iron-sulfur domain protein [Thalassoporum mexicanum PCC 7367]|uniref:QcrA and Rieske domain-containing protein n=1 Tax=Thalassoporum mexicanum TaxID=3457544 RepID=UPI00029F8343|nr:ubiquinol-cytochrome c reductase iron-sulfur subunit [Pseudanabaena sp. PCC 7367]AFY70925.1 Rieske (2Fe-2S) iron-sulfur domain protein [Pseudanabaena sp. PCC 7367]
MIRRDFLSWVGLGMMASFLPVAIAACSSDPPQSNNNATSSKSDEPEIDTSLREDGFQAFATVEQIDEKGSVRNLTAGARPVLIFRDPDSSELVAFDSTCTHQACNVTWDGENSQIFCPCHSSAFNPDGTVKQSPADDPLTSLELKEEDGLILVKAS